MAFDISNPWHSVAYFALIFSCEDCETCLKPSTQFEVASEEFCEELALRAFEAGWFVAAPLPDGTVDVMSSWCPECGEKRGMVRPAYKSFVMNKNFETISFKSTDALATAAAEKLLREIQTANDRERAYSVALSGGRIANNFYDAIVKQAREKSVAMPHVHFFWADERCVPPDDAESNYKTANDLLFKPLNVPPVHVHRILGEESPEVAAQKASADILETLPENSGGQPVLDLIILGIGPDGHTASLFPREPESMVRDQAVYRAIYESPKPPPNRVTMGYQMIAAAKNVWVLVSGEGKDKIFTESLQPGSQTPFARVLKLRAKTEIFSDLKKVRKVTDKS